MEMRKSLIKFGSSFGSSFHMTKEEKQERKEMNKKREQDLEFILEDKKEEKTPKSRNKKYSIESHDLISKKFDEMEEILAELQKKEKEEKIYLS
jgi:hypothetical protein